MLALYLFRTNKFGHSSLRLFNTTQKFDIDARQIICSCIITNVSFGINRTSDVEVLRNFWPITDTSDARRTRLLQNSIPIHLIRLRMRASLSPRVTRRALCLLVQPMVIYALIPVNRARTQAQDGCVTRGTHVGLFVLFQNVKRSRLIRLWRSCEAVN